MTAPASPPASSPFVEFRDCAFSYGGREIALEADLCLDAGSLVGLVGPSGAGKTTLLRAVLGQLKPVRGEILIDGQPLGSRPPRRVGYVPQLETIDWSFPITVEEAVLLGRVSDAGLLPWPSRKDRAEVAELLERLGLAHLRRRHIRALSGGQQQRVFLARALIRRPDLLLLDEPTSGIDVATRQDILTLLRQLNAEGIAIVLTTHDLNAVAAGLPELVCMNRRVIAHGPPDVVFTPEILRATFGSEMIVFHHDGMLLTADAPLHGPEHPHHAHVHHGAPHVEVADLKEAR
ncbi:MAG: zinc/manganese transport system ATP-binding protein [Actinomycetota bacterium]|nr:zinc/manganese transport system ATP-binding protein [Actinomycetota bacterium]